MTTYHGTRDTAGLCRIIGQRGGARFRVSHRVRHSPAGFEWGYEGSGPADTARSLLAAHLGFIPHPSIYQRFKRAVVATLPREWQLTDAQIGQALERIQLELGVGCVRCADRGVVDEGGPRLEWCPCPIGVQLTEV